MRLSLFIARRYLVRQKGTFSSFIIRLAILATALSVAVMIAALAVVTGFRHTVAEKLFGFKGHVQVAPFDETGLAAAGIGMPMSADPVLRKKLEAAPHVLSVAPFATHTAILSANGLMEGLQLKGVDSFYHFRRAIATEGKWLNYTDSTYSKDIILSRTTANRLNLRAGDPVQVNFVDQYGKLRIRRLKMTGTYHSGMEDMDKYFALCDLRLIQRINNWPGDTINGFQLDLDDDRQADATAEYIHYNIISPPLAVYTTVGANTFIFDWLKLQGGYSTILIALLSIVAVINLSAALLILIVDRAVMIGLLKALGMPFEQTRSIFIYIAALIGGAGILAGNIIGLGLCLLQVKYGFIKLPEDQYFMRYAPIRISWWQVGIIDIVTLLLCVLCMWLPTLYIRRVQPARVLQFK